MNSTPESAAPRPVTLPNDFGAPIGVTASMVAEDIHFSTTSGVLTVEKLYHTVEGKTAYGIIAASGETRERRAYLLDVRGGESVIADNGNAVVELNIPALREFLAMALQSEDAVSTIGEHVQAQPAANGD